MEKICGIYKFTNNLNGKVYIGKSVNIYRRYSHHISCVNNNDKQIKQLIHKAIRKYGLSNFSFSIIEECNKELLDEREIYWIKYYNSFNNGYNMTEGGDGGLIINEKTREKHRESIKRKWTDPKFREKVMSSKSEPWNKGHHLSDDIKEKISKSKTGKSAAWNKGKTLSDEHKVKLSVSHKGKTTWNKGRKLDKETKNRISNTLKDYFNNNESARLKLSVSHKGKTSPRKGVSLSEETKRKISETKRRNNELKRLSA